MELPAVQEVAAGGSPPAKCRFLATGRLGRHLVGGPGAAAPGHHVGQHLPGGVRRAREPADQVRRGTVVCGRRRGEAPWRACGSPRALPSLAREVVPPRVATSAGGMLACVKVQSANPLRPAGSGSRYAAELGKLIVVPPHDPRAAMVSSPRRKRDPISAWRPRRGRPAVAPTRGTRRARWCAGRRPVVPPQR